MIEHPPGPALEELAAGAGDAKTREHLATCEACAAYVAKLEAAARAFGAIEAGDAERFVARVEARARRARPTWARATWVLAPLAAAAAVFLLLRTSAPGPRDEARDPPTHGERFKGGVQVAAVIDRDGRQERAASDVHVRPGDRLRIEVSLDSEEPVVAGVLEKDGTWTPLLLPARLEAGTHYSEQAARFDAKPTDGWILAGRPDDVERARQTRVFTGVAVLPIVSVP